MISLCGVLIEAVPLHFEKAPMSSQTHGVGIIATDTGAVDLFRAWPAASC